MIFTYFDAVLELVDDRGGISGPSNGPITNYRFENGQTPPTEEEIQTKLTELRAAEPMRLLRQERNRRIAQTDWRFRSDLSPSQEWKDYCVALRDLPANYSPTFDILTEDEYPLVKEDNTTPWPEEPTDG